MTTRILIIIQLPYNIVITCPSGENAACCDTDGSCVDGDDDWCCNGNFYCSNDGVEYANNKGGILCGSGSKWSQMC